MGSGSASGVNRISVVQIATRLYNVDLILKPCGLGLSFEILVLFTSLLVIVLRPEQYRENNSLCSRDVHNLIRVLC